LLFTGGGIDIVILSNSSTLAAGKDQQLFCVGHSSSGVVNITWTFNNATVPTETIKETSMMIEDREFQVSSLMLCNVQACDSGMYTCNASNTRGYILGNVVILTGIYHCSILQVVIGNSQHVALETS